MDQTEEQKAQYKLSRRAAVEKEPSFSRVLRKTRKTKVNIISAIQSYLFCCE